MIARIVEELGPWNWMVLGFILLAVEIVVPGFFLIWIGVGAILTGMLTIVLWEASFWAWQVQVVVFLALSLASVFVGRTLIGGNNPPSDQPLLNQRGAQLVGRTATLQEPIREGFGRIRIDDTVWRVQGPDTEAGVRVKVVSANGGDLVVDKA